MESLGVDTGCEKATFGRWRPSKLPAGKLKIMLSWGLMYPCQRVRSLQSQSWSPVRAAFEFSFWGRDTRQYVPEMQLIQKVN